MAAKPTPDGYTTVAPYLFVEDASRDRLLQAGVPGHRRRMRSAGTPAPHPGWRRTLQRGHPGRCRGAPPRRRHEARHLGLCHHRSGRRRAAYAGCTDEGGGTGRGPRRRGADRRRSRRRDRVQRRGRRPRRPSVAVTAQRRPSAGQGRQRCRPRVSSTTWRRGPRRRDRTSSQSPVARRYAPPAEGRGCCGSARIVVCWYRIPDARDFRVRRPRLDRLSMIESPWGT